MAIKGKKETIEKWINKGAEWCAEKLWIERQNQKRIKAHIRWMGEWIYEAVINTTKNAAYDNLIEIVKEYGLPTSRLTIFWNEYDCETLRLAAEDFENPLCKILEECEECEEREAVQKINQFTFYAYEITDGLIDGITAQMERLRIDATKIIDERTGAVLWEPKA